MAPFVELAPVDGDLVNSRHYAASKSRIDVRCQIVTYASSF